MQDVLLTAIVAVVGYLLGTIPSAGVVAWVATRGEINLREAGSGNPGAINAIKMLGTRWGVVVLVADIVKGTAAGLLGLLIAGDPARTQPPPRPSRATSSRCGAAFGAGRAWRRRPARASLCSRPTSRSTCSWRAPARSKSKRADIGTQVACLIWIASAAIWWAADLPNLWGPDPSIGLLLFALIGSTMILYKFLAVARVAIQH